MKAMSLRSFAATLAIAAFGFSIGIDAVHAANPPPARGCPFPGWQEGLNQYQKPTTPFPTEDTAKLPTPDCNFHQWSWEAFVWATALLPGSTVPRFMTLPTPADLLSNTNDAGTEHPRELKLAARSHLLLGANGFTEGTGAIVQADGNMQVALNGYPVYASVHMNPSYFNTAKKNLIVTGGYAKENPDSYFNVGDAIFKATWLRYDDNEKPPVGAYTTKAQVPVLATQSIPGRVTIAPVPGKFVTVNVALVGLHVVGYTVNHPEFLWGTFEHALNSPATADNTFTPAKNRSDPKNYTFYKANTPFSNVNQAIDPPILRLDEKTQKLSPVTNVVLENKTGGENQENGVGNIIAINGQGRSFFANQKLPQSAFSSYYLVGTVWMLPNKYNLKSDQTSAVGSVNLANGTAETFIQNADNKPIKGVVNCFFCHNPASFSFQTPPPPKLPDRLIALSHVLSFGSIYAVPNEISGKAGLRPPLPQIK